MIGFLFIWIGIIIATFTSEHYNWAVLITSLGFTGIAMFLFGGGIWNNKLDRYLRIIMIIIARIILISVLSSVLTISGVSNSLGSLFSSIPGYS